MKNIINPFDNNCIGCSPQNPWGLKMAFAFDEITEEILCKWQPINNFQGYPNVLHGGIQTLMMDEIGAWSIYILLETAGVTKNLQVNFINPCYISRGTISLRSKLLTHEKQSAVFHVDLYDGKEKLCSQCKAEYFIYPQTLAKKKFGYPGISAFFEK